MRAALLHHLPPTSHLAHLVQSPTLTTLYDSNNSKTCILPQLVSASPLTNPKPQSIPALLLEVSHTVLASYRTRLILYSHSSRASIRMFWSGVLIWLKESASSVNICLNVFISPSRELDLSCAQDLISNPFRSLSWFQETMHDNFTTSSMTI